MVGLVLVSHSARLAAGLAELLGQLAEAPVVAAGGTAEGGLGTSAELIASALARADDGDGVVVIPDLGSAVLAARLALEDAEIPALLADVPFVEGAVAAAVAASTGADLVAVLAAAEGAWSARKLG